MIAKKIYSAGLVDFNRPDFDLGKALEAFQRLGLAAVLAVETLSSFDRYVVKFFFDGITVEEG